jgi:hypothetical protein
MELRLHASYARSWGVDVDAPQEVHPATRAYTDFLMEVAEDPEGGAGLGGGEGWPRAQGQGRGRLCVRLCAFPSACVIVCVSGWAPACV